MTGTRTAEPTHARDRTHELPVPTVCDVALGFPYGPPAAAGVRDGGHPTPTAALRAMLHRALRHAPCVLAFSGGRDSSLLLALAADVATRDGLEPPRAVTFRYPGDAAADEARWQRLVVDHLRHQGLRFGWTCLDVGQEFDVLGPLTTPVLADHGHPLWPAATGPTTRLAQLAQGGTVVSGNHGDEVFAGHRATVLRTVVHRRGRGLGRDAWIHVALSAAPVPVRRPLLCRTAPTSPWLREPLREAARRLSGRRHAAGPLRWDDSVRAVPRDHAAVLGGRTLSAIAGRHGATYVAPLGELAFVDALAARGGRWGPGGRSACMRMLADGLLPDAVLDRTDKAYFNASRFGAATAEFVRGWDGSGLDETLVDRAVLRRLWTSEHVPARTAMLLQQAWLSSGGGR